MPEPRTHAQLVPFGALFFLAGVAALLFSIPAAGPSMPGTGEAVFFFTAALLSILAGYEFRRGYVSFDRLLQVSLILIFSPWQAALINGAASLVFPWVRRDLPAPSFFRRLNTSLFNSGLMVLMILAGGHLYLLAGGEVPLRKLELDALMPLAILVLTMQLVNELGMLLFGCLEKRGCGEVGIDWFSSSMEMAISAIAVLMALIYNLGRMDIFVLFAATLAAGILVVKKYAGIRLRLEQLVEQRTAELEEQNRALERLATHDSLTGLYNRRFANDFLKRLLERDEPFAVAMLDIDHFKEINDRFSHEAGDHVLQGVSKALKEHTRGGDLVARYGGEEFLLCFPHLDREEGARVSENLRGRISEMRWREISETLAMGVSIGVADSSEEGTLEGLLRRADRRMYRAKRLGRNQVIHDD